MWFYFIYCKISILWRAKRLAKYLQYNKALLNQVFFGVTETIVGCFCVVVWVLLSVFCISSLDDCMHPQHQETTIIFRFFSICFIIRACLHGGGGPQIGEVICGWSPHLSCKCDKIKMRDYVDRWVTHQSGLPHLPGVPHLHVNRPLVGQRMLFIVIKDFVIIYRCSLYRVANIVEAFFLHFFFGPSCKCLE